MLAAARRGGVRILGPNCLGVMRTDTGLNATFARKPARTGNLAAGLAVGRDLRRDPRLGGPRAESASPASCRSAAAADVDFGEVLDFLVADGSTEAILLYVEGIRDARRYLSALRAAARVKPVIALKVGRYASGSRAASSHTGALVGSDAVFDAALRRAGTVRVKTYTQLFAAARAAGEHAPAAGRAPRHRHQRRRPGRGRRRQRGRERRAARYAFCARPLPCWMRSCRRSGRTAIRSTSSAMRRPSASPRPRRRCSPTRGSMRCSRCTRRSR